MINLSAAPDLSALFDDEGQSLDRFCKKLKAFVTDHEWEWFGTGATFNLNSRHLYRAFNSVRYHQARRSQLTAGGFDLWIIQGSDTHSLLHGVCLQSRDEFWNRLSPPFGWQCDCYLVGARNEQGCLRLDGDLDKPLPQEWRHATRSNPPAGVDTAWNNVHGPDILTILEAISNGDVPDDG